MEGKGAAEKDRNHFIVFFYNTNHTTANTMDNPLFPAVLAETK